MGHSPGSQGPHLYAVRTSPFPKLISARKIQITIALNRIKVQRNKIENNLASERKVLAALISEKKDVLATVKAEEMLKETIKLEVFSILEYHLGVVQSSIVGVTQGYPALLLQT